MAEEYTHRPVLLDECIEGLNIKPEGTYVDGTLGRAGHSMEIAKRLTTGRLYGIDRDLGAHHAAQEKQNTVEGGVKPHPPHNNHPAPHKTQFYG